MKNQESKETDHSETDCARFADYAHILEEELLPAMGCTEPIAIAYAAAKAREVLGALPDRLHVAVSGNIIKNVKSVVVPHTGGLSGIPAACAVGVIAGDASRRLEVISDVTPAQIEEVKAYLKRGNIEVEFADTPFIFDIGITAFHGADRAYVRIVDYHTNLVQVERNDSVLFHKEPEGKKVQSLTDRSCLNVRDILAYADQLTLEEGRRLFAKQVEYNMSIAEEGLSSNYGANIGKVLLKVYGNDVRIRAKAYAAAGSDARMNGCEKPVVINSGSGNQGMTASIPVIIYAREYHKSELELYRALAVSNLCTIHMKTGIGRLSAYCGAVSAGCGSGAGIAYLLGGGYAEVAHTLVNALAIVSGIICDGAKASCAAKVAFSVEAGILGYEMYLQGNQFLGGDGIVKKGVENTIRSVGQLAHDGMADTDREIIQIMLES